jgi:ArsR family transcriptional regulator
MSNNRNNQIERLAGMFKALSNDNRLRIFLRLAAGCETAEACCSDGEVCACVGDLGRDLGIVPSTVSHHIKELHRAGLIRVERRGQSVECSVDAEALRVLEVFFGGTAGAAVSHKEGRPE